MDSILFQSLLVALGMLILLAWGLIVLVNGIGCGLLKLLWIIRDAVQTVRTASRLSV